MFKSITLKKGAGTGKYASRITVDTGSFGGRKNGSAPSVSAGII